jgi:hypothetical protein
MKQTYGKAGGSSFFAESSRLRLDSLEHYSEPSSHTSRGAREVSELATIGHARIERYLSYDLILPKTTIFITNGGFTGVKQALGYGVPLLVAGSTEEKPLVGSHHLGRPLLPASCERTEGSL